ncbi:MAG: hypothetical protein WD207_00620 [Xanthobacteraceae bacterium]
MSRKQLLAMASVAALGLATAASGSVSAAAIYLAPDAGTAVDSNVIQVQGRGHEGRGRPGANFNARGGGSPGANFSARGKVGLQQGPSASMRGNFRSGPGPSFAQRGADGPRGQIQKQNFQGQDFSSRWSSDNRPRGSIQKQNFQGQDFSSRWNSDNRPRGSIERHRGNHRVVWHGRHHFHGAFLFGVPFGVAVYASHPCYDWIYGPQGLGYYWNYDRCPV